MQLRPATATATASGTSTTPRRQNIAGGTKYLAHLPASSRQLEKSLDAYNAGRGLWPVRGILLGRKEIGRRALTAYRNPKPAARERPTGGSASPRVARRIEGDSQNRPVLTRLGPPLRPAAVS